MKERATKRRRRFSLKEKLMHYRAVADGTKKTRPDIEFSDAEQKSYAAGQCDARCESIRIYKWKCAAARKQASKDKKAAGSAARNAQKGKGVK